MVPFGSGTVGVGETSLTGVFSFGTSLEGDSCFGIAFCVDSVVTVCVPDGKNSADSKISPDLHCCRGIQLLTSFL